MWKATRIYLRPTLESSIQHFHNSSAMLLGWQHTSASSYPAVVELTNMLVPLMCIWVDQHCSFSRKDLPLPQDGMHLISYLAATFIAYRYNPGQREANRSCASVLIYDASITSTLSSCSLFQTKESQYHLIYTSREWPLLPAAQLLSAFFNCFIGTSNMAIDPQ